jgi:hypothetical protein
VALNIEKEVAAMRRMTVGELQRKYAEVFGENTNGRHKEWLLKRIAWRMQANEYGGLSQRARQRAREIANEADLRTTAPKRIQAPRPADAGDDRLPPQGNAVERVYKGHLYSVTILDDGFEFEGERYKSLSAIAKTITGQHWNGYRFFNLTKDAKP